MNGRTGKKNSLAPLTRSALFVAGMAAVGIMVQWFYGPFDIRLLVFPANLFAGLFLVALGALVAVFPRSRFTARITGVPLSAALIIGLGATALVMGLIPQSSGEEEISSPLPQAMHAVTGSWPFMLLYVSVLFVLICVIVRRAVSFRFADYGFYLNHVGLLLLLAAGGLGAADKDQFRMFAYGDTPQDGAVHSSGRPMKLPFTVTLDKFDIEYYPASVAVARWLPGHDEPETGLMQLICSEGSSTFSNDMQLSVLRYVHNGIEGPDGFMAVEMSGGSPAAYIRMLILRTGETAEGWVTSGDAERRPAVVEIGNFAAYMPSPEPKRYLSDITLDTDGHSIPARLEVNKPFRYGHWRLYQYGYDTRAGRLSRYSIIRLVYDPWLWVAYTGIILLAAGCLSLVWTGRTERRKEESL